MESRVIGNFHARFGAGENLEIISKDYLSLKVSTLHLVVGVAHIYKSHMGAGSITSNVKSDKTLVVVKDRFNHEEIETGLKKMGAMLGDYVEVGCNSVLNPGTVIGRNSNIYPLSRVRGVVLENSIFKELNDIVEKK